MASPARSLSVPPPPPPPRGERDRREILKKRLFNKCDKDGDGVLKHSEARQLAGLVGFEGSEADWVEEYPKLCGEHGILPEDGIPESVVMQLLDDNSDTGCYCTDQELGELLGVESVGDRVTLKPGPKASNSSSRIVEANGSGEGRIVAAKNDRHGDGDWSEGAPTRGKRRSKAWRHSGDRTLAKNGGDIELWENKDLATQTETVDYYGHETDGYTIFFSGAAFESTPGHLRKIFKEAGSIAQFWLFQLPDGRSRGMGVVQYERLDEAQYAIELLHSREIDGRSVLVKYDDVGALASEGVGWDGSDRDRSGRAARIRHHPAGAALGEAPWTNRVFFAGAPFHCTAGTLRSYFAALGQIRAFTVFWVDDVRHRGMGVCTFETNDDAEVVLNTGIEIEGFPLYLQEDTTQYNRPGVTLTPGRGHQPLPGRGGSQALIYGSSESSSYGPTSAKSRSSRRSTPYDQRYDSQHSGLRGISVDPNKAVFFANVPLETTESYLKIQFESAGHVNNLILFMSPDGKSRGMGIVEFTKQAGAMRAYNNIHEKIVSGRPIIVDEYRAPP